MLAPTRYNKAYGLVFFPSSCSDLHNSTEPFRPLFLSTESYIDPLSLLYHIDSPQITAMATVLHLPQPARNRIVRMTNVHFDVDEQAIKDLLKDFTIENQCRATNTRTGTLSVVYVLFATVVDRIRAAELDRITLLDRKIKIQPAHIGNYERECLPLEHQDQSADEGR
jgi:hypothetical protein